MNNSKMEYLNVQLAGMSGRPHPALTSMTTTCDEPKIRLHLKFLTGDYPAEDTVVKPCVLNLNDYTV